MKILKFSLSLITILVVLFLGLKFLDGFEQRAVEQHSQNAVEKKFHQNPDVFAWLTVEGTRIDYPVAQHPRDDAYYLSHDIDGKETYYGAIFTELVNKITFEDPVTIIYGHAMLDDSMFGSLDYFAKPAFFKEHERITIDTLTQHFEYEVLAAHSYTDDHLFHTFELGSREGLGHYLDTLQIRTSDYGGFYRQIVTDPQKDRFLILSTCDAIGNDQRFVVTARLKSVKERTSK